MEVGVWVARAMYICTKIDVFGHCASICKHANIYTVENSRYETF